MSSIDRSSFPGLRALAALAAVPMAGACTYDFAQFEGLGPAIVDDAGVSGRGGGAGSGASAPDGSAGRAGSSGAAGSGQGGSAGAGGSGGTTGGTTGSGGATGGTGSGGTGATGGVGGSGGSDGKGGAAGSGGSGGAGGTAGKPDASTDAPGGTGGSTGGSGGATGGTGGVTGGSGGATGGTGGATGGTGGTTGGTGGSAGTSIADASDVNQPPDAAPDRRDVDVTPDAGFDCAAVSGKTYLGHCYFAKSVAVDWNTANTTTCEAPAHLATITTAGEQAVVAGLLSNQDRWIGLRRPLNSPKAESSFYWVTNEALTYRNWDVYSDADREPNYTGECVRMRFTSAWADVVCTEALAVICEHD